MKQARILMVEDEPDILEYNAEYLRAQGYEAIPAETLARARFLLEDCAPDLILLDVMMPDGSGFDFCEEIKEKTKTPVIYLSGRTENESQLRGLRNGGKDYITKPYDLEILGAKIKLRLEDAQDQSSRTTLDLPPLHIDTATDRVTLLGRDIPMSHKEVQLLYTLASAEGRRFGYGTLYSLIWGGGAGKSDNHTIAVHIHNIRKKLGMDGSGFFEIRSTRAKEYMFNQIRF